MILEGAGYRDIEVAHSAGEAFVLLGLSEDGSEGSAGVGGVLPFDLVLLDIMMPGIDGIEACAAIRATHAGLKLPIVMLSAVSDVRQLNQAFMAGAHDFVAKPTTPVELVARVNGVFRMARMLNRSLDQETGLSPSRPVAAEQDAFLLDRETSLLTRRAVEQLMNECRIADRPLALALLQVNDCDAYESHWGRAGVDRLMGDLAAIVRTFRFDLGTLVGRYDKAALAIAQPGAADGAMLAACCAELRHRVDAACIEHGNALHGGDVGVTTVAGWATGADIGDLPAKLLDALHRAQPGEECHALV
jgi:PleD family two-component response regulator